MSVCLVSELTAFGVIMDLFNVPALPAQITVCLCTTIYTVVSGMQASILTDTLQGAVMILLIILATISFGLNIHLDPLIIQNSPLLTPTSAGIESLYTLIVAVFAANIFHQGYWQRVYVARSDQHLFKACIFSFATTLVVMFLIGFTGVAAVWSGVVHVNDNMAFFKLIQTLPPWTNHLLLLLATCFISSSVDTLQNGIVASIVHDVFRDAISLNKARIVAALINIPALLIATLKLDVFSLYLMADLFASMIFGPLLLGLVTKFDLHRKLNGADFCIGVLGGLLSVVAVGTLVHGGNVYKGIELLRLPNGVTGSSNDQSINDSLYAFIAAPFGSVVIMFCSYITRSRCQEQQSQQQPLASPTTSFNRIRSPSLFKGSEPVAEIIFVA